ncbi:class I SAM-dependent methyltransferase, partial [Kaarinaea lacus]
SLADRLQVPLLESCEDAASLPYLLTIANHTACEYQLELRFPTEKLSPIVVDFQNQRLLYRQKFGGGRQQPIARALGLKKAISPFVVDATAGLGRDAFILATLGCRVHMIERNPIIHALLEDGLRRLARAEINTITGSRTLDLSYSESREWLLNAKQAIDIVYLDPMYPHRSKSALVKKEMRILRKLVGDDLDVAALLDTALRIARQRVVVKRPKAAPPIGSNPPSHCVESKNTRFDVYLTHIQDLPKPAAKP